MRSALASRIRTTDERPSTDFDRIVLTPGTPASALSIGTLTSDSTSGVDSPGASVWISTSGGANSGNTSSGIVSRAARGRDGADGGEGEHDHRVSQRDRDQPAHGYLPAPNSVPNSSAAPAVTTVFPASMPRAIEVLVADLRPDLDAPAHERRGAGRLVDPCAAVDVVDDRRSRHDERLFSSGQWQLHADAFARTYGAVPAPAARRRGRWSPLQDRPTEVRRPATPSAPARLLRPDRRRWRAWSRSTLFRSPTKSGTRTQRPSVWTTWKSGADAATVWPGCGGDRLQDAIDRRSDDHADAGSGRALAQLAGASASRGGIGFGHLLLRARFFDGARARRRRRRAAAPALHALSGERQLGFRACGISFGFETNVSIGRLDRDRAEDRLPASDARAGRGGRSRRRPAACPPPAP